MRQGQFVTELRVNRYKVCYKIKSILNVAKITQTQNPGLSEA